MTDILTLEPLPGDLTQESDDALDRLANSLDRQRERVRDRGGRPFRSSAHEGINELVASASALIDTTLGGDLLSIASPVQREGRYPHIADAWILVHDASIAARWHAAVDASSAEMWSPLDRPEYDATLAAIDLGLARIRAEQARRRRAIARARLDAEEATT